MKVGSLVVCVRGYEGCDKVNKIFKDKIYTVRDLVKSKTYFNGKSFYNGRIAVYLEEICNKKLPKFDNTEAGYKIDRFRELDTPQSISIEQILEEPFYA